MINLFINFGGLVSSNVVPWSFFSRINTIIEFITCFSRFLNLRIFSWNFMVNLLQDCKMSFSVRYIKQLYVSAFLTSIENVYLLKKPMVSCYQNCSDLLWEKIVLVIEKNWSWRPRIYKNFEITRTICSNSERSEQFLATECFFNLFLEVSHI